MHHKNNFYIWFGIWVIVLPFLGVPTIWKVYLTSLSGLYLLLHASWPTIMKKLQSRAAKQRKKAAAKISEDVVIPTPTTPVPEESIDTPTQTPEDLNKEESKEPEEEVSVGNHDK